MPAHHVSTTTLSPASPAAVFALLADISSWPVWGSWEEAELEAVAPDGTGGVGAIRRLTSRTMGKTIVSRERVEEVVPEQRIVYALLSGLPLEGYRGVVELEPTEAGGTRIHWSSTFDARYFGTGWFYELVLRKFIADTAQAVARQAARDLSEAA